MKFSREQMFRFSTGLVLAIGLAWTAVNIARFGDAERILRNKIDATRELRGIKQKQDLLESAFISIAAVSNAALPLSILASSAVTGQVAEIRELDSLVLDRGLAAKRTEVKFSEVSLNSIGGFLRAAETQRPPWRMAECVISASPGANGVGSAAIIMETIVPQRPDNGQAGKPPQADPR